MWQKSLPDEKYTYEQCVQWSNTCTLAGYTDWQLPNAKKLQNIIDYERSPSYTNSPAISSLFDVPVITDESGNDNYPFYLASTTHDDGPTTNEAAYVCFGEVLDFMEMSPNSGNYFLQDVHGAGAQRSDPKEGDPDDYPYGHGTKRDVIRIYNYIRLVRDVETATSTDKDDLDASNLPREFRLDKNFPNPFNPNTAISFFCLK